MLTTLQKNECLMKNRLLLLILVLFSGCIIIEPVEAETNTIASTLTGTTTVDKTPPTASAPNLVLNNQDVCSYPASAAIQTQILGFAAGTTIRDKNCERLKLSRVLYFSGMKVAAVSLLCQDTRVYSAMNMAGTPCPYMGKIGAEAAALWEANPEMRPDYKAFKRSKRSESGRWTRVKGKMQWVSEDDEEDSNN